MVPKLLNLGIAHSDRKTCTFDFGFDLRKIYTVYTVYNKSYVCGAMDSIKLTWCIKLLK